MTQKIAIWAPSHNFVGLYLRKACIDNRKKNLLSSNTSSTCPHNMVKFGPKAAEIVSLVWGTPCKFQRVLRLDSVTARHCSSGRQPNFAALNRGRHLYSAGRPSRYALAHISSFVCFSVCLFVTLVNVRVCAHDFAKKALECRNDFVTVG